MSKKMNTTVLSEGEELLLMKYVDGECGYLERSRAERMLQASPEARSFVDALRAATAQTQAELNREIGKIDLWANVSRRIEAEEHAALFLGKRTPAASSSRFGEWLSSRWAIGMSGAAVTAALAIFALFSPGTFFKQLSPAGGAAPGQIASNEMLSMVRGVSMDQPEGSRPHGRPRIIDDDIPNVVEVDWMRSDGRVRIMPSPSKRSAIIWVKKRDLERASRQGGRAPVVIDQDKPFALAEPGR